MRKKLILMFVFLTAMITFTSCAKELRIVVPEDENIVTRELREYLKKTPSPKIVLKIKEPLGKVSHHELSNYITVEKELFKAGFIVRDRMLFQQVLESGGNSYKELKEKVDTDLILEITNLSTTHRMPIYRKNGEKWRSLTYEEEQDVQKLTEYGDVVSAILECKIVLVKSGRIGGMFTIYAAPRGKEVEKYKSGYYLSGNLAVMYHDRTVAILAKKLIRALGIYTTVSK